MKVKVTKDFVTITENSVINSGEVCINECEFSLPENFERLSVTATFSNIPVPLNGNKCFIPALPCGNHIVGVYAYKENESGIEIMYSPKPAVFYVSQGSFSEETNEQAVPEISVYEQYCKMIKDEYEKIESDILIKETERDCAEQIRQSVFSQNENKRQSSFSGIYTNLLKDIAEENSTTDNPAQIPAHKTDVMYEQSWAFKFTSVTGYECYILEAQPGDRFNISGYNLASAAGLVASVAIVDSSFAIIDNFNTALKATNFCCGLYACPENTAYVILNKKTDGNVPVVTKVDEPVFETLGGYIPTGTKCTSPLYNTTNHATYLGSVGTALLISWKNDTYSYYSNGIYPLEEGIEYVLYIPESCKHVGLGYICNSDFTVNVVIGDGNLDENRRYVFTATENDKYIALNCYDFRTLQFGKNKSSKIKTGANIGKAFHDGVHDISLEDMGIIDRSLSDKKWVSYGDSITLGVGVDYVNGEKLWQDYLVERFNIGSHVKMGVGYSSLAYSTLNTEKAFCNNDRLNALINESPDIVTILGGANDFVMNIPLGTDEDVKNKNIETFKGAYAYIIDKILTAKPDTTLVLLGMWHIFRKSSESNFKYKMKDYSVATKEIAEHFGLPFVDLNECGFNSYNYNLTDGVFSTDEGHPNKEGTKRIAMVLGKWFDSFKGTVY